MSLVALYPQKSEQSKRHKSARWLARQFDRGVCPYDLGIARIHEGSGHAFEDLEQALQLVHNVYVRKNYILPRPSRLHLNLYLLLPRSRTFIVKEGGQVVATISVVLDSPMGLPIDRLYPEAMSELRRQAAEDDAIVAEQARSYWDSPDLERFDQFVHMPGPRIAELTAFALHERYQARSAAGDIVFLELLRKAHQYSVRVGITNFVIEVTPNHGAFYERFCGFETFASGRRFPVDGVPAVGMKNSPMDLNRLFQEVEQFFGGMNSILKVDEPEQRVLATALQVPMLSPAGVRHFLEKRFHPDEPPHWFQLAEAERTAFRAAYAPFGYDFSWADRLVAEFGESPNFDPGSTDEVLAASNPAT